MKNKYLLVIMLALVVLPFYSAQAINEFSTDPQLRYYTSDGYVIHPISVSKGKINRDIYLNFRVYDDSGKVIYVDNANVNCSAFMFSPEGDYIYRFDGNEDLDNISDTGRLALFPASFINETGYYKWYVSCQNENTNSGGAIQGELLVTITGFVTDTPMAIMYGIVIFLLFFLFIGSFIWFLYIPWEAYTESAEGMIETTKNKTKKTALFFLSYIMMLLLLFVGKTMTENYMQLDSAGVFFEVFFTIFLVALAPLTIASVAIIIISTLADKKLQKQMTRGLELR